jgi:hypothetical protein
MEMGMSPSLIELLRQLPHQGAVGALGGDPRGAVVPMPPVHPSRVDMPARVSPHSADRIRATHARQTAIMGGVVPPPEAQYQSMGAGMLTNPVDRGQLAGVDPASLMQQPVDRGQLAGVDPSAMLQPAGLLNVLQPQPAAQGGGLIGALSGAMNPGAGSFRGDNQNALMMAGLGLMTERGGAGALRGFMQGAQVDAQGREARMTREQEAARMTQLSQMLEQRGLDPRLAQFPELAMKYLQPQEGAEPKFGVIGQDAYGQQQYGWIDPRSQTVTPAGGQPQAGDAMQADSAIPPPPPGVDPATWRREQTERLIAEQNPMPDPKAEGALRSEIRSLPSYKNYEQARPIFESMVDAAQRDTKAADLNLVVGLGKLFDPTSVVREGEMVMVQNAQSLSQRTLAAIAEINNGGRISPQLRAELMAEGQSRMQQYESAIQRDLEQFRTTAEQYGFEPSRIVPNYGPLPDFNPQTVGGLTPGQTIELNGASITRID